MKAESVYQVANKNDILKQEIARAAAFDVFQYYRQNGATGSPATTVAGKKRLDELTAILKAQIDRMFCERCGLALLDGQICPNYGCEHDRILSDIDDTA